MLIVGEKNKYIMYLKANLLKKAQIMFCFPSVSKI